MAKLSIAQHLALDAIRAHGGMATPEGGGWWKGLDNERLYIEASSGGVLNGEKVAVGTTTIYALERRGWLKRRMFSKHRWKDSYVIDQGDGCCTYPRCKCIVSTSTTQPEPVCPLGRIRP